MIGIAIAVIALIIILLGVLFGIKRGLFKNTLRLVCTAVSVPLALLLSLLITRACATPVAGIVKNLLASTPYSQLFENETALASVTAIIAALSAALTFPLIFIIVDLLTKIIDGAVKRSAVKSPDGKAAAFTSRFDGSVKGAPSKIIGALLGCLTAIIIVVAVFAPLSGIIVTASSAFSAAVTPGENATLDTVGKLITDASGSVPVGAISAVGGKALYNGLTTCKVDGQSSVLDDEVKCAATFLSSAKALDGDAKEWGTEQSKAITSASSSLEKANVISSLVACVLSDASDAWLKGETYCGLAKPEIPEEVSPLLETMLKAYIDSDAMAVKTTVSTLSDILALFIEHNTFASFPAEGEELDLTAISNILSDTEMLNGLMEILKNDPKLNILIPETYSTIMRVAAKMAGLPADGEEAYTMMLDEVALAVTEHPEQDATTRAAMLTDRLAEILASYGITLTPEQLANFSIGFIYDYLDASTLTADDISRWLKAYEEYSNGTIEIESLCAGDGYSVNLLMCVLSYESDVVLLADEQTTFQGARLAATANATPVESVTVKTESGDTIKILTLSNSSIAVSFNGAPPVLDDAGAALLRDMGYNMTISSGVINNLQTPEGVEVQPDEKVDESMVASTRAEVTLQIVHECNQVFSGVSAYISQVTGGSFEITTGGYGDFCIPQGGITGGQTSLLLDASGKNLTVTTSENMAVPPQDSGKVLVDFTKCITEINKIIGSDLTEKEKKEAVSALVNNITPYTASTASDLITAKMLSSLGVPDDKTAQVSKIVKALFKNLSELKDKDGETSKDETEAVAVLFRIALNAKKTAEGQSVFGKDGVLGMTAQEAVSLILGSDVTAKTLTDSFVFNRGAQLNITANDPFGIGTMLAESDKSSLESAVNAYTYNGVLPSPGIEGGYEAVINGELTDTAVALRKNILLALFGLPFENSIAP